jgi:hypothetical protein
MGGRTLDRPWSDEAHAFERGLAPGSASQLTRATFRLSPVFHSFRAMNRLRKIRRRDGGTKAPAPGLWQGTDIRP